MLRAILGAADDPDSLMKEIDRVHSRWCQVDWWVEEKNPLVEWLMDKGWDKEPLLPPLPLAADGSYLV
jgi:hypothetical protein